MGRYLRHLSRIADVTVVDGSDPAVAATHAAAWGRFARIVEPRPWPGRNGKVAGAVTGVYAARHEPVVLADDDVRYARDQLRTMASMLAKWDVVIPQNVLSPHPGRRLPWHARWDTARSLLNRLGGGDYPGTYGLRRSVFIAAGGYDGDVLFENLQMVRTMRSVGAAIRRADGLYVERLAPTTRAFLGQRVRQAYDDFGQPVRLVWEASWLPAFAVLAACRPRSLLCVSAAAVAAAELGRRRCGGARVFTPTAAFWAPLWVLERAVCVWLAIYARSRGGVRYYGVRVKYATRSPRRVASKSP